MTTPTSPRPSKSRSRDRVAAPGVDYDPKSYIIPASSKGQPSLRIWVRVPPVVDRQADLILNSRVYPFRTRGDLHRWCLVTGLKHLVDNDRRVPSLQGHIDMMLEVLRHERFQIDFLTFFQQASEVIGAYVSSGSHGEARRIAGELKTQIDQLPGADGTTDGEDYWRGRYQQTWQDRFGFLFPEGVEGPEQTLDARAKEAHGRRNGHAPPPEAAEPGPGDRLPPAPILSLVPGTFGVDEDDTAADFT